METRMRHALSRWQNVLIEAVALSVIGVSAILTAHYFGFDSPDPVVKLRAVVYAFGVDGAFYTCVQLTRHYLFGSKRNLWAVGFWFLWTLGLGAFTYHNNLLFAAGFWQLNPDAVSRAGVTETLELHLSALIPVAIIVLMALIPRRHAQDTRTPAEIRADTAREVALLEAKQEARTARAKLAGTGLRGTIGGFVSQAINLEDRRKAQEAAAARHAARELRRARQRQLEQIALDHGLVLSEVADLEAALADRGLLPAAQPSPTSIPSQPEASASDETPLPESGNLTAPLSLSGSGMLPSWLDASAAAAFLGVRRPTAKRWMEASFTGPYRLAGCRNFDVRQGDKTVKVRKAPLKSVAAVKALLDAARHSHNGTLPTTVEEPEQHEARN